LQFEYYQLPGQLTLKKSHYTIKCKFLVDRLFHGDQNKFNLSYFYFSDVATVDLLIFELKIVEPEKYIAND